MIEKYKKIDYECRISNDFDEIVCSIVEFMKSSRIKYDHCDGQFRTDQTLNNHLEYFHRIIEEDSYRT